MKLCWSWGPIEPNALPDGREDGRWTLRDAGGVDISDAYPQMNYADDETGEIWHFTLDAEGRNFIDPVLKDRPAITRTVLGPGAFEIEWRPRGTRLRVPADLRRETEAVDR